MKKLVLSLAVLFSVAMVSCSGNKEANDSAADTAVVADTTLTVTEEVVVDSPVADSPAATVDTPAANK